MKNTLDIVPLKSWLDTGDKPLIIAGPCSAETEDQLVSTAHLLANTGKVNILRAGIWKPRTRPGMFEGVGALGLKWLQRAKEETGLLTTTEVANTNHVDLALKHDIRDAIVLAKAYLNRGIRQAKTLGPYAVFEHGMADIVLTDMPKLCYSADVVGKTFNFPKCPLRLGIYPVVDSSDWVQKLTQANIKTIQLRIKDMPDAQKSAEIKEAANCCDASIAFFVNDYWQQAIAHNAYGVHLGQEDLHDANLMEIELAGLRLGISTHSYWELARALAINPSYIALGPVFATTSKEMPWIPQGVERVRQWEQLLGDEYPLVAIGGIDLPRSRQLKQTGVGSVAMISAITQAEDYREATAALLACWRD